MSPTRSRPWSAGSLTGTAGDDTLTAAQFSGSTSLLGLAGADSLVGGSAADVLTGGDGADNLAGGAGTDALDGGDGADTATGGLRGDTVTGGAAVDNLKGEQGDDDIQARDGLIDLVDCGDGTDSLTADEDESGAACETILQPPPSPSPSPSPSPPPAASPSPSPSPSPTPNPSGKVAIVGARVVRGRLVVRIRCPPSRLQRGCTGRLTTTAKKVGLGSARYNVRSGRRATLRIKLSRRKALPLVRRGRLALVLRGTPD